MIETLATTRKIGGSIVVTIPSEAVKIEQLRENQIVKIKIEKKKIDGFGALKGICPYNREEDRAKGQLEED